MLVRDTGIGMSKEQLEKVYQPFYPLLLTEWVKVEGHGLGMAITKKTADALGIDLRIDSELGQRHLRHTRLLTKTMNTGSMI